MAKSTKPTLILPDPPAEPARELEMQNMEEYCMELVLRVQRLEVALITLLDTDLTRPATRLDAQAIMQTPLEKFAPQPEPAAG